jgi:hypothetical protein
MRRAPALMALSAFAAALALATAGCSSGPSSSSQAEQAMYSAASHPIHVARSVAGSSLRAGQRWAGSTASGLRMAVPVRWVTIQSPAALHRALRQVGLGQASAAQLAALVPGRGSGSSVDLADPGPVSGSGAQAVISLNCSPDHFPPGTHPAAGLTTLAESEFTALNASNAQIGPTSVDGRPAVLVYDQASVGTKTVTGLQYAIAAPGGRACYVTLVTEKPVPYEPAFGALRPAIRVMP